MTIYDQARVKLVDFSYFLLKNNFKKKQRGDRNHVIFQLEDFYF